MKFPQCKVKSVKADIANGNLTIAFSMAINDANMETAEALGLYVGKKDGGEVELRIIPQQIPLKGIFPTRAELVTEEKDNDE
jgi:hypothetical protein